MRGEQMNVIIEELWRRGKRSSAVRRLGTNAVRPLIRLLESDDWETRVKALSALREFGSVAHSAAEAVALLTVDSNRNVRFFALQALGKLGPSDSLALSALLPALTDSWPAARTAAALALRDLDCPGSPESLTTLLLERLRYEPVGERSSSNLRRSLAAALGECGELDERVYPAFLEMARADEERRFKGERRWLAGRARCSSQRRRTPYPHPYYGT